MTLSAEELRPTFVIAGPERPFWSDYRKLLERLDTQHFPRAGQLNRLLPPEAANGAGVPLRFVQASEIPGVDYERHIFATGEVSTRGDNWHDLFNALVWCRLPRLKAALNALHCSQQERQCGGRRGCLRDALTLLDESGAIVLTNNRQVLRALADRDWRKAFDEHRPRWGSEVRVIVCGHGLLEKFLKPYKAMTAHALLCHLEQPISFPFSDDALTVIDAALAKLLLTGTLNSGTSNLSPLPLMGIPGWWPGGDQDLAFYQDPGVFRAAPAHHQPAPIQRL